MDIGIIASRYAKALHKYAEEQGDTARVYEELVHLTTLFQELPKFKAYLTSPELTCEEKIGLLRSAFAEKEATLTLNFLALVIKNQRAALLTYICHSYLRLYRKRNRIAASRLITASKVADAQVARFKEVVAKYTEGEVELQTMTDEELLGGFVLEFDGYRIDASLRSQLEQVKRQLMTTTL